MAEANVVKALHARLRRDVQSGLDHREVWHDLLCDHVSLQDYSKAMHTLATQHWPGRSGVNDSRGECSGRVIGSGGNRISWCVDTCREYYGVGNALQRLLLKDLKRRECNMPTILTGPLMLTSEDEVIEIVARLSEQTRTLLDVGSCFNPFSSYSEFNVTALDIAPANETVNRCDFLSVSLCDTENTTTTTGVDTTTTTTTTGGGGGATSSNTVTNTCISSSASIRASSTPHHSTSITISVPPMTTTSPTITSPIIICPLSSSPSTVPCVLQREGYQVVVFSLFLSYLPLPQQRLQCCVKAHQLLVPHGLLLIVTPDSSHQNKHAQMMRSWKETIQAIGFHRWKYVKDTHLHCMAFRKVTVYPHASSVVKESGLYIPQDKQLQSATRQLSLAISPPPDDTDCSLLSMLPFNEL